MSQFFTNFNKVDYAFGDEFANVGGSELTLERYQDITSYVEVIDELKDLAPFYKTYYVLENDRPDQVSQKIWNNKLSLDFFIMNDHIRRSGFFLFIYETTR